MKKIKNLKKTDKTIAVYTLTDNFTVEVERNDDITDFYMCNSKYCSKMYMFGIPNCPTAVEEALITANAEDYMRFYTEQYENN
jgi:hypothetical protein